MAVASSGLRRPRPAKRRRVQRQPVMSVLVAATCSNIATNIARLGENLVSAGSRTYQKPDVFPVTLSMFTLTTAVCSSVA